MPELPEVETVRRQLAPWLTGRTIIRARRAEAPPGPKYAHLERADGQRIEAVERCGKYIVMPLDGGDELVVHLGMTGQLGPRQPVDHLRVRVDLDEADDPDRDTLFFRDVRRFGRFVVAPDGDRSLLPTLAALGPEPLSEAFTVEALREGLRTSGPVKQRLMGQRAVAGVGNIYCDEALWRARIHPMKAGRDVSAVKARRLRDAIVEVLEAGIAAGGTTLRDYVGVDGEEGRYVTELMAYGRTGEPCPRCTTPIRRILVGQRSTHFCPRCQRK